MDELEVLYAIVGQPLHTNIKEFEGKKVKKIGARDVDITLEDGTLITVHTEYSNAISFVKSELLNEF